MASKQKPAIPVAVVAVVLVVVVSWWHTVAFAQSSGEAARTYFDAGTLAEGEGRWIDCARNFERSFAIVVTPELLYQIGVCYQRAAAPLPDAEARPLLERARTAYRRYLREIPEASDADRTRLALADIEARLDPIFEVPVVEPHVVDESPPAVATTPATPLRIPDRSPREPGGSRASTPSYDFTIGGAVLAAASLAVAIGLGVHAENVYARLTSTCGGTAIGCTEGQISDVSTFATAANVMYVAAGGMLGWTAFAFMFEFGSGGTAPSRAAVSISGRF